MSGVLSREQHFALGEQQRNDVGVNARHTLANHAADRHARRQHLVHALIVVVDKRCRKLKHHVRLAVHVPRRFKEQRKRSVASHRRHIAVTQCTAFCTIIIIIIIVVVIDIVIFILLFVVDND